MKIEISGARASNIKHQETNSNKMKVNRRDCVVGRMHLATKPSADQCGRLNTPSNKRRRLWTMILFTICDPPSTIDTMLVEDSSTKHHIMLTATVASAVAPPPCLAGNSIDGHSSTVQLHQLRQPHVLLHASATPPIDIPRYPRRQQQQNIKLLLSNFSRCLQST